MIRALLAALLLLALGLAGLLLWPTTLLDHSSTSPDSLVLHGSVEIREARLAFEIPGRIRELAVTEGQRVAAGDIVARLHDLRYRQAVEEAEAGRDLARARLAELEAGTREQEIQRLRAEVAAARARAVNAEHEYQRLRDLSRRDVVSPQTLDNAESAMQAARAELVATREALALAEAGPRPETIAAAAAETRRAESRLAAAQTDLSDTRLAAPASGVIRVRVREVGEVVAAGEPVYTLALNRDPWVRVYLPEPSLGRVQPGTPARITTDSFPERVLAGWIGYISPTAEFTPKSVATPEVRTDLVYEARVRLCRGDSSLRLGMPATARLETEADPVGQAGVCGHGN
ncbi:MAG: HlyD family efflux transporter periplasmic adaptor subunit [Candidatus Competibacterales bacterium]|nr:HlyD family efflux transporter periplasmic adaptor subunit [Candidatus Competibacterales bacterium]